MGRYANLADGVELKLTHLLCAGIAHVVSSRRALQSWVKLNRKEVEQVLVILEHMNNRDLANPTDREPYYTKYACYPDTVGWFNSHFSGLHRDMLRLRWWLLLSDQEFLLFG